LILIGDGNLTEELKKLACGLDVDFVGKKKHVDLPKYLQEADVFILPSLNEGMSNSVLEAMACGLPVIVTDVGGSAELVEGNGIVVDKGSIIGLKNAIEKYIDNPELISCEGKKSRLLAEKMSWENMADGYENIYGK